ncbi:MAG: radical SAM protein [Thermodesulfobacteriota bacterium]|nr:radical SAM protein [Thermodesulfobacteriota bacterium]
MSEPHILLIYPAYTYPRKSPPLGLAYLAAYLREAGFRPYIHDFNTHPLTDDAFMNLLGSRKWLIVGISFMTNQFGEVSRLAPLIKQVMPDIPLVAGGPHPSSIPERTLQELPALDIIVRGEGEETLKELAEAMSEGRAFGHIPGLCFRAQEGVIRTPDRAFIRDLDRLPFPAWKYLDLNKYNVFNISGKGDAPVFALLSSRGCPNFCTFCDSHTIFGRKFRPRSAQNIFDEIIYLNKTYGMVEFDFVDDLVTIQKKRILELCELIGKSDIPFRWMANARVNTVDREMLQAMKDAGCIRVDFGVETGDQYVRKLMRKNITDVQIRNAHQIAHDIGISTGSFTMVGNLGETKNSAKKTVELLKDIGDDVMVAIACPFPGTELYRVAKEKGLINTEDWTRYVTSPTYTPNYRPVMRTEYISEDEIVDSFYYIHSFFARRKFQRRFGRYFFLNPRFYREWVFNAKGLRRRFKMAIRLVNSRIKAFFC